jgi:seryl-tRNA synthetase
VEKTSESILQLSNERKELKNDLENINLEQKVVEKKTIRMIKDIEKTKADITSIKESKEKLALEIIDLQQGEIYSFSFLLLIL